MRNRVHLQAATNPSTNIEKTCMYDKELFSVAPMMAHTNRHYRYFWRLLSSHTFLYTEMIPASQIVNAYNQELVKLGMEKGGGDINDINSEEILEVVHKIQQREDPNYQWGASRTNDRGNVESLYELLCSAEQNDSLKQDYTTLQIGGKDPYLLAKASAVGAAFGSASKPTYSSINLNCGCPSNAVSGRSGGASLMKEPMHVAKCVEAMNNAVTELYHAQKHDSNESGGGGITPISVKHRLGVRDALTYNVEEDKLKSDEEEAFPECCEFIKAIGGTGDVKKFQVHARLGLLGDFEPDSDSDTGQGKSQQLWVPKSIEAQETKSQSTLKVDHKRAQHKAKKRARKATIQNRSVPPLRPGVVDLLVDEFAHLEFVTNGGIKSMDGVQDRLCRRSSDNSVIGAMVGRSAINHPCSFSSADALWEDSNRCSTESEDCTSFPSRGDVLLQYIQYCELEEDRVRSMGVNINSLAALRRRLVAVPFHLFVGEMGDNVYQRRIRKLASRSKRYTAKGMLLAALNEVPVESINKSLGDFITMKDLGVQNYGGVERSGPLQKSIY